MTMSALNQPPLRTSTLLTQSLTAAVGSRGSLSRSETFFLDKTGATAEHWGWNSENIQTLRGMHTLATEATVKKLLLALSIRSRYWHERMCCLGSKFFPVKVDTFPMGFDIFRKESLYVVSMWNVAENLPIVYILLQTLHIGFNLHHKDARLEGFTD